MKIGLANVKTTVGASPYALKYRTQYFDIFLDPDSFPAIRPPWGTLNAIDLNAGTIRWSIPFGRIPWGRRRSPRSGASACAPSGVLRSSSKRVALAQRFVDELL